MSEPTMDGPRSGSLTRTRTLTTLAMLTGIAYVVMLLSKMLPQVSGFLQFDLKDTIICIGGFVFGPASAALVSIVVALIEMFTVSDTGPIGLVMNVLATTGFCCTASAIYKRRHTMSGAILGLSAGVVILTTVMLLWNYLITPMYLKIPRETVTAMLLPIFLPFNLVKGGMNMAAVLLLYKPIVTALRRAGLIPPSETDGQSHRSGFGFGMFSLALMATFLLFALVLMGVI